MLEIENNNKLSIVKFILFLLSISQFAAVFHCAVTRLDNTTVNNDIRLQLCRLFI